MKEYSDFTVILILFTPLVFLILAIFTIGDYELFTLINQGVNNPILDFTCAYLSPILFSIFYFFTLASIYSSRDHLAIANGVTSLISGPLSYYVGSFIKPLIGRPRPFNVLPNVRVIGFWHTSTFSFPSTTTMLVFGFTLPILFEDHRLGLPLTLFSYLIGFSVIYTGFHFPGDVLAGILLSISITICTNRMKKLIAKTLRKKDHLYFLLHE